MDDAVLACARLLREGAVPRAELGVLDHADVRAEVERRLAAVGLILATSAYSDHVGIRLSPDVTGDHTFDSASNLGLKADGCALLVVLWARLVLQKRTAQATREVPDAQAELLADHRREAALRYVPHIRVAAVVREFGHVLGSATHVRSLVTQLRKLGFVGGRGEILEAGPLLELGVDGERMTSWIRREVLAQLLAERDVGRGSEQDDMGGPVLAVLDRLGGSASISDLERETKETRPRLKSILRALINEGRVRRIGERGASRYDKVG